MENKEKDVKVYGLFIDIGDTVYTVMPEAQIGSFDGVEVILRIFKYETMISSQLSTDLDFLINRREELIDSTQDDIGGSFWDKTYITVVESSPSVTQCEVINIEEHIKERTV